MRSVFGLHGKALVVVGGSRCSFCEKMPGSASILNSVNRITDDSKMDSLWPKLSPSVAACGEDHGEAGDASAVHEG